MPVSFYLPFFLYTAAYLDAAGLILAVCGLPLLLSTELGVQRGCEQ